MKTFETILKQQKNHLLMATLKSIWWREQDSNLQSSGYEPDEMPITPSRDIYGY